MRTFNVGSHNKLKITSPTEFTANIGSHATVNIDCKGNGRINIDSHAKVYIYGSGNVRITSLGSFAKVEIHGNGNVHIDSINSHASVDHSGRGILSILETPASFAKVSGDGDIRYGEEYVEPIVSIATTAASGNYYLPALEPQKINPQLNTTAVVTTAASAPEPQKIIPKAPDVTIDEPLDSLLIDCVIKSKTEFVNGFQATKSKILLSVNEENIEKFFEAYETYQKIQFVHGNTEIKIQFIHFEKENKFAILFHKGELNPEIVTANINWKKSDNDTKSDLAFEDINAVLTILKEQKKIGTELFFKVKQALNLSTKFKKLENAVNAPSLITKDIKTVATTDLPVNNIVAIPSASAGHETAIELPPPFDLDEHLPSPPVFQPNTTITPHNNPPAMFEPAPVMVLPPTTIPIITTNAPPAIPVVTTVAPHVVAPPVYFVVDMPSSETTNSLPSKTGLFAETPKVAKMDETIDSFIAQLKQRPELQKAQKTNSGTLLEKAIRDLKESQTDIDRLTKLSTLHNDIYKIEHKKIGSNSNTIYKAIKEWFRSNVSYFSKQFSCELTIVPGNIKITTTLVNVLTK